VCISSTADGGLKDANPSSSLVFVTRSLFNAAFGGLSGGDGRCQNAAAAGSLPGTYNAWLSDGTSAAASRVAHRTGPYVLVDGTVVANGWSELTSGALEHAIDHDEFGIALSAPQGVWTSTQVDGSGASNSSCSSWTSASSSSSGLAGNTGFATPAWTSAGAATCDSALALYCIQQ
jgi:hypothetical protein